MRLGAIFIAICMVLIAGSAGVVAFLAFAFSMTEAIAIALAVLVVLAVYNAVSARLGLRTAVGSQLTDLSRGGADLARQVAEMGRRLATLESKVENTLDKSRAVTDPLAVELGELGALVKQIADTVATHETSLTALKRSGSERAIGAAPAAEPAAVAPASEPTVPIEGPGAAPATTVEAPPQEDMLTFIRGAIDASRIDLYLQPIVTLPQRKVRYYEAMSRLRSEKGEIVPAANFIELADSAGLMPKIDNLVIFRCVQVVRRLLLKNREIGLFCNVAGSTLTDATVFQQLLEFMEANRAIAPSIVLEFTQAFLRSAGPIENESLHALHERGFRFSLDNVHDLRIEPRDLAQRGFRFVKVPASLLLNRTGEATTDIHPADLSDLLGRFGIDLVAEKIESEGMVVDLLDYDVRYGQGFLFSPPRPVRAEALQGIAERSDLVARETGPEAATGGGTRASDDIATTDVSNGKRGLAQLARRV